MRVRRSASASCVSMITHHYAELFQNEPQRLEEARRLAPRSLGSSASSCWKWRESRCRRAV
jgi:hypothetical protein